MTQLNSVTEADRFEGLWRLDPDRISTVNLSVRHLFGLGTVRATMSILYADLDAGTPAADAHLAVLVDAASFASGNSRRDRDVTGPDFLDVAAHPTISYHTEDSPPVSFGNGIWIVHGVLTVRGVSRPTGLHLLIQDAPATIRGEAAAHVAGQFTVDRRQYGSTANQGIAGNEVHITIDAYLTRIDPATRRADDGRRP